MQEFDPKLPVSLKEAMRSTVFMLHGGDRGFDIWLSKTADDLANPALLPKPPDFKGLAIPATAQEVINSPHGIVDHFLEHLDTMGVWEYQVVGTEAAGWITVTDQVWGHVIEQQRWSEENLQSLAKKYGVGNGIS
jgi:hypothetical protein